MIFSKRYLTICFQGLVPGEDHGEGAGPQVWEGQEAHGQCAVHQASGFGPNIQIVRARVYQLLV
jgi:hypothetical protein